MGMDYDIFSASAANAANKNLDASILAIQMIKEMRDWETVRFNNVIDRTVQIVDMLKHHNNEINDLKAQVAGLQSRLYQEQEKNKGIAR